jgi:putative spermidine/putrescine transport system permease protein
MTGARDRSVRALGRMVYLATVGGGLAIVLLPLFAVVWVSFFADRVISFPPSGYTVAWFGRAWRTDVFHEGFVLSLELAAIAMAGALAVGVPASLALDRFQFAGREAIATLLVSPVVVPGIVAGSSIYLFYIQVELATDIQLAATLPGLIAAHVLTSIPWTVRLVTASLTGLDRSVEEAAQNLGAPPWIVFRRVTLPMIKPGVIAASLFSFIISFTDLEKSLFLIGPGKVTIPIAILNYLEWSLDPTITAVATMQIAVIAVAMIVSDRYVKLSRAF